MAVTEAMDDRVQRQTGGHGVVFCDEETKRALAWSDVWQQFAPVTVYGSGQKQALQPFRPGQEADWERALAQLREDAACLAGTDVAWLQAQLASLPDITDVLPRLDSHVHVLSPGQLLALKRFVLGGQEMASSAIADSLAWAQPNLWHTLLAAFGGNQSRTFAIDQVAGVGYAEATQAYTAALGRLASVTRERDAEWSVRTGVRPTRDSLLTLPLPERKLLADSLKCDAALQWLRDTPFESVFEVLPTAALEAAQEAADAARLALTELEADCLKRLTQDLQALYPHWCEAAAALADLDLRLAKVQLLLQWRGAVPGSGPALRLNAGVHPLWAGAASAKSFVPIHLEPVNGVNLLCGSNMGGKTVAMQTVVLCQLLAQHALPVPAGAFTTRLFTAVRFSAAEVAESRNGLSSFGREAARLTAVWRDLEAGASAICCFDEPGRSTNPVEGEALAVGLVRALRQTGDDNVCFVATHFAAPVQEQGVATFRVRGLRTDALAAVAADASLTERLAYLEQAMDYCIERMASTDSASDALTIAEWLGIPEAVLVNTRGFLQRGK